MVNSPATVITTGHAFTASDTTLYVDDLAVFPAAPNLVVIGTGEDAVTYIYSAKSGTSGAGTLTIPADPEEGTEKSWVVGTPVYRGFCAYDHDSFKANIEEMDGNRATKTEGDYTVYVDSAASGAEDGTSWTDAFTTIQDAIDSLPEIIAHEITISVRKGSSDYSENVEFSRMGAGGKVTLEGEYWYRSINDSSKTGKLDFKSDAEGYADRARIAAGDVIWGMKFTGTVWDSTPDDSFRDTVASISGTEITLTTNTGKAFTTAWGFCVVKTRLVDDGWETLRVESLTCPLDITGMYIGNDQSGLMAYDAYPNNSGEMLNCYITGTGYCAARIDKPGNYQFVQFCYFYNPTSGGRGICAGNCSLAIYRSVVESNASDSNALDCGSAVTLIFYQSRIAVASTGASASGNSYVLLDLCDNEGTTPVYPTGTSDGTYIWGP